MTALITVRESWGKDNFIIFYFFNPSYSASRYDCYPPFWIVAIFDSYNSGMSTIDFCVAHASYNDWTKFRLPPQIISTCLGFYYTNIRGYYFSDYNERYKVIIQNTITITIRLRDCVSLTYNPKLCHCAILTSNSLFIFLFPTHSLFKLKLSFIGNSIVFVQHKKTLSSDKEWISRVISRADDKRKQTTHQAHPVVQLYPWYFLGWIIYKERIKIRIAYCDLEEMFYNLSVSVLLMFCLLYTLLWGCQLKSY